MSELLDFRATCDEDVDLIKYLGEKYGGDVITAVGGMVRVLGVIYDAHPSCRTAVAELVIALTERMVELDATVVPG